MVSYDLQGQVHSLTTGTKALPGRLREPQGTLARIAIDYKESPLPAAHGARARLMRNPGRELSRQETLKAVWDTHYVGDTRTLNVHVRWLRLKIEDDPGKPRLLRPVRGVGYRFEPVEPAPQESGTADKS